MLVDERGPADAAGPRGLDVVLVEDLEEAGADDPGHQAGEERAEGDRGQDQAPEALGQIGPRGHVSHGGEPAEVDAEDPDQDDPLPERGHRVDEDGEAHRSVVPRRVLPYRGDDARGHRDQDPDDDAGHHQGEGGDERVEHERGDPLLVEEGVAEVPGEDAPDPDEVLGDDRAVEAELVPEARVRLLREIVAEPHQDRVARDHPHQGEDDHRHREEHGQRLPDPREDESHHAVSAAGGAGSERRRFGAALSGRRRPGIRLGVYCASGVPARRPGAARLRGRAGGGRSPPRRGRRHRVGRGPRRSAGRGTSPRWRPRRCPRRAPPSAPARPASPAASSRRSWPRC